MHYVPYPYYKYKGYKNKKISFPFEMRRNKKYIKSGGKTK